MDNFDYLKYLDLYPDLLHFGIKTQQQAYNHYILFGKKESRVYNIRQLKERYKMNMDNEIKKINNFSVITKNENKIHIIVRTHLRETYFKKVIKSILSQNYDNYIIHIVYDHIDSLDYIKKFSNDKIIIHKVTRKSDKNVFFDLYCNDIKDKINDGWIMFLDDDNQFIHVNCLTIINMHLQEKILVWCFLRPDKLIIPDLKKIVYGEIDNCNYIFHHSIKNDGTFSDNYGSDYQFINSLLSKNKSSQIDLTLISTQFDYKISNYGKYENTIKKQFIDLNRIDFDDYKNHYKDLQELDKKQLIYHYDKLGKYESRIIKFLDFNYDIFKNTINHYLTYHESSLKFSLITTLYNEINEIRLKEYLICLNHHQKNQFIEKIVIFYDDSKGQNVNLQEHIANLNKIEVVQCTGHPYFINLFNYSNQYLNKKNIIICNSDIIFDHTLHKLENINLENKIYALTRWDYVDETSATPRLQKGEIMNSSKDSWIFQTPFNIDLVKNNDEFKKIQLGTWNCDGALNYFLKEQIIFECINIKSYHVHFCNGRTYLEKNIIY